jgi:phytol kinase
MSYQILYTVVFTAGFIGLILFSELLYAKYNVQAEITRKLAHIASALFSLVFLSIFQSYWYVVILGVIFFLLLFVGKRFNIFKSIYAVERKIGGSYLLPVSICLLFIISKINNNNLLFVLPILTLAISDPLAGIFGTVYKHKTRKIVLLNKEFDKTIIGSSVFFISTLILSIIVLPFYTFPISQAIIISIVLSVLATFVEIISINGSDNLTVPLLICLILFLISNTS